ncbi:MAG: endonuclease/exonuclease/phosphatase family protein [Paludibacteraceae bacterium]|nr:endonuclease/exonuclease/phosphatase family protein [Paludibacteraceae bacterium]
MTTKSDNSSETRSRGFGVIRFTVYTFAVLLNGIVAFCTLTGKMACHISPIHSVIPAYLGLFFPYLIAVNVAFILFWAIKRKLYILLPILTLIICFPETRRTFSIGYDSQAEGDTLAVMSYNVQMFEFFTPLKKNQTIQSIIETDADIVCIQEYGSSDHSDRLTKKGLKEAFSGYKYIIFKENDLSWEAQIGEAILSKYPIINHGLVEINSETNGVIYADILFKGDTIRVFNCHLESNKITETEKKTLQKIKEVSTQDANKVVSSVSKKMSESYRNRALQAEIIHQKIEETRYPVILCGDLNDVPVSYAYHTIRGDQLKDAFQESAFGYGYTYNKKLFHFRIDQIMHSKESKAIQFKVGDKDYSDHYPISCKIVF